MQRAQGYGYREMLLDIPQHLGDGTMSTGAMVRMSIGSSIMMVVLTHSVGWYSSVLWVTKKGMVDGQ